MDVYGSPEKFGLTLFGEVELAEPCYSFDLFVVWHDATGTWFYATDSGCSCPSPFEDYRDVDSLTKASGAHDVAAALQREVGDGYGLAAATDLINRVMASRITGPAGA